MDYIHDMIDGTNAIKTVLLSPKNPRKLTATQLNTLRTIVLPEREKALAEAKEMMTTTKAQYQIKYVANNANGGRTYYDPATQKIVMEVINPNTAGAPLNGWSNAIHEMKHGFQFIDGKTSFNKIDGACGSLCDIYDEVEAYKRECIFIQSYQFGTQDIKNNSHPGFIIDPASVIQYGNTFTPPLNYQLLPANQRNITTPEGQLLIFLGITSWEIFVQP